MDFRALFSFYLGLTILWSGEGFNEFDKQQGIVNFRWGFQETIDELTLVIQ
jgi:hypothetical protein